MPLHEQCCAVILRLVTRLVRRGSGPQCPVLSSAWWWLPSRLRSRQPLHFGSISHAHTHQPLPHAVSFRSRGSQAQVDLGKDLQPHSLHLAVEMASCLPSPILPTR